MAKHSSYFPNLTDADFLAPETELPTGEGARKWIADWANRESTSAIPYSKLPDLSSNALLAYTFTEADPSSDANGFASYIASFNANAAQAGGSDYTASQTINPGDTLVLSVVDSDTTTDTSATYSFIYIGEAKTAGTDNDLAAGDFRDISDSHHGVTNLVAGTGITLSGVEDDGNFYGAVTITSSGGSLSGTAGTVPVFDDSTDGVGNSNITTSSPTTFSGVVNLVNAGAIAHIPNVDLTSNPFGNGGGQIAFVEIGFTTIVDRDAFFATLNIGAATVDGDSPFDSTRFSVTTSTGSTLVFTANAVRLDGDTTGTPGRATIVATGNLGLGAANYISGTGTSAADGTGSTLLSGTSGVAIAGDLSVSGSINGAITVAPEVTYTASTTTTASGTLSPTGHPSGFDFSTFTDNTNISLDGGPDFSAVFTAGDRIRLTSTDGTVDVTFNSGLTAAMVISPISGVDYSSAPTFVPNVSVTVALLEESDGGNITTVEGGLGVTGNLTVTGSYPGQFKSVQVFDNASATISENNDHLVVLTGLGISSALEATLPSGVVGGKIDISNISTYSGGGSWQLRPASGQRINGGAADTEYILPTSPNNAFSLVYASDDLGWMIIGQN